MKCYVIWLNQAEKLVLTIDAHNHSIFKSIFKLLPGDVLHPHQFDIDDYDMFLTKRHFKIEKQQLIKKNFFQPLSANSFKTLLRYTYSITCLYNWQVIVLFRVQLPSFC